MGRSSLFRIGSRALCGALLLAVLPPAPAERPAFCSQCGIRLGPQARFCGSCGKSVG